MNTTITAIISRLDQAIGTPVVVGVAGGSGSGKSYFAARLAGELTSMGIETVVINQDDFGIGRNFKGKKTSLFKWDDPENYRLSECVEAVEALKRSATYSFLAYTLEAHEPVLRKTISWTDAPQGRRVVIVEGIFAWFGVMSEVIDYRIFLDVNPFIRFVLRANRNVYQIKNTDFNTVVNQYFSHVMRANTNLIEPQKQLADDVIRPTAHIHELDFEPEATPEIMQDESEIMFLDETICISVHTLKNRKKYMTVRVHKDTLFHEELTSTNVALLIAEGYIKA